MQLWCTLLHGVMKVHRSFVLCLVVAVAGCEDSAREIESDAAERDAVERDALPPDSAPPRCDPAKPFAAPVPIGAANSTAFEDGAYLSSDELTLYFGSTRPGGAGDWDLYESTRPSVSAAFGAPVPVAGVDTVMGERWPAITASGLTLYATRVGTMPIYESDILSSTRMSTSVPFPPLTIDPYFSSEYRDEGVFLLPDRTVFWCSLRTTNQAAAYTASWNGTAYSAPSTFTVFANEPNPPCFVVMTADQRTLYVSSSHGTFGVGDDIWVATRAASGQPFGEPTRVEELSADGSDSVSWVSTDGCVIALTRYDATTKMDLYLAQKPL